ncbi:MAG: glucose-6-phosphate dehydrogenase assembly protein OpcA [Actinobacteria bacterium]|nr:glucose-6-phosphate dehydrogenase assembly protein OpcA [Thermoleophilia bacterium]MCB9011341.1 glucose-6-phosphate dehydrogenase assembly protein OpcA [Actinomycetota bacterium]
MSLATSMWDGHVESVSELAGRLNRLHAVDDDGQPLPHAGVLNLVAFARDENGEDIENFIEEMTTHQPSRAIIVKREWSGEGIDAHLETRAHVLGGSGRASKVELIRITLRGESTGGAASAVRALVRSDLPVFVWWPDAPDISDPVLESVLEDADRLISESTHHATPAVAIGHLVHAMSAGPALTDLAWAELTPWRQLMNQMMDAGNIERLQKGGSAEIWYPGETPTVQALLMGGWLRDALGSRLHIEFIQRLGEFREGIAAVRLESLSGRQMTVERYPDRDTAAVVMSAPMEAAHRRVLPLPCRKRSELLAGELELQRPDRPFERALPIALELSTR